MLIPFLGTAVIAFGIWNLVEVVHTRKDTASPPSKDLLLFLAITSLVGHAVTNFYYMMLKQTGLLAIPLLASGFAVFALTAKTALLNATEVRDYKYTNRDMAGLSSFLEFIFYAILLIIAHPWYKPPQAPSSLPYRTFHGQHTMARCGPK